MSARRILTVSAITLAVLLGLATAAIAGLRFVHRGQILPGVSVAGVDVGGLDEAEARAALGPTVAGREADAVTFTLGERTFTLTPDAVDYRIDVDATIAEAMELGRSGELTGETWRHVAAYWDDHALDLRETYDDDRLDAWVREVATEVDHDPFPGAVTVDARTLQVASTPPSEGVEVHQDDTRAAILDALSTGGPAELELPADILPARIEASEVDAVARQAERAVAAPLTLTSPTRDVTLQPTQLAPLVSLTEVRDGEDWTVELDVTADEVESLFADLTGAFEVAPVDARFDLPRTPAAKLDDKDDVTWRPRPVDVPVVGSRPGLTFDPELAADQLEQLLAEGVRSAELRLAEVEPEFTTEEARALNVDTLLSTFTTYHACCQTRVKNIQRLADLVDDTIVEPGEQFSVNQISGERTCSKGFAPAGMILRGEVVDVCGGGVSQFGTTTVNAVFFAGLEPDAYKPHSFYISRYPMGREATLNYPSPDIDVKFTNDTGNGIVIHTSYTPTSITVSFYGHTDVARVTAIHGSPANTKPYPTEYRENKALPPQSSRTIQSGKNGFSIKVSREIEHEDGTVATDDWSNVYVPEREIIERNTSAAPPPPPPSPQPSPSSEPKPKPSPSPPPPDQAAGD